MESQSLSGQIPTRPCHLPALGFSCGRWELQISMSLCCRTPREHLAWQDGAVCCVFLTGAWHSATPLGHGVSQGNPRAWQAAGSGSLVPCRPLVPASPRLHSTANSCCSTLNFHFSFTKIKNQAHNQAESSQNLRWEALLRTEARRTVFQRLIAFSECISIYFFPQHWNPWVLGSLRKEGILMPEDKEPRQRTKKEQKMKMFLAFFSKALLCFYLIPCVTEDKNCKYWGAIMQAIMKPFAFITYCEVTKSPFYTDSLLSGFCYLPVSPHAGLCL